MAAESSGFLGKFAADRPWLATTLAAFAMTALCVVGVRQAGEAEYEALVSGYLLNGLYVLGAPLVLAAAAPRKIALRVLFLLIIVAAAAGILIAADSVTAFSPYLVAPDNALTIAALSFFVLLVVVEPFFNGGFRLIFAAPFAALLGASGAVGFLALEGMLKEPSSAAALSVALAAGVIAGIGVGADYAGSFARGAMPRVAAAKGGHAGVAPAMFAILTVCAFFALHSWNVNFGAVEWPALWGAAAAVLLGSVVALVVVAATLSLSKQSEQIAVNENRRREWFARVWLPVRRILPAQTALAASAIFGILAVVALFEVGLSTPFVFLVFLGVVWAAAALVFVSLRTSLLIAGLLFASAIFADYGYGVFEVTGPALLERMTALTLAAIALAQLTVSWRNAGDIWRNARDIAQNAMSDGLRRFLVALGAGAASLVVSAHSFGWSGGFEAAAYFLTMGAISLILAPVMMVALSARASR